MLHPHQRLFIHFRFSAALLSEFFFKFFITKPLAVCLFVLRFSRKRYMWSHCLLVLAVLLMIRPGSPTYYRQSLQAKNKTFIAQNKCHPQYVDSFICTFVVWLTIVLSFVFSPGRPYRGKPSDMWALGVVLFTMLYGQFPFYDSIPQELFRKIKAAEYNIPEWVSQLLKMI